MKMRKPTTAEIRRVMTMLSRRGAALGGHARAAALSPERRSEIARIAVQARIAKKRKL